jgi:hypothetical protein
VVPENRIDGNSHEKTGESPFDANSEILMPSFKSSLWILGAPQPTLSRIRHEQVAITCHYQGFLQGSRLPVSPEFWSCDSIPACVNPLRKILAEVRP